MILKFGPVMPASMRLLVVSLLFLVSCGGNSVQNTDEKQNDSAAASDSDKSATSDDHFIFDSTKKYVFLTFDDGPQPGTENVIHAIRTNGVKGSFFMVGVHATYSKGMMDAVDSVRTGYPVTLLANHSYSHAYNDHYHAFYNDPNGAEADFEKAGKSLNIPQKIVRFPGNNAWVLQTRSRLSKLVKPLGGTMYVHGYRAFGWDVEWHFKRNPAGSGSVPVQSAEQVAAMIENVMTKQESYTHNCVVLLAHDRMFHLPQNADSLSRMIALVKEKHPDYIFETVDHYPGLFK